MGSLVVQSPGRLAIRYSACISVGEITDFLKLPQYIGHTKWGTSTKLDFFEKTT